MKLRVVQVSPRDVWSGAERIAWLLFRGLKARGFQSEMAVGVKTSADPDIRVVPHGDSYPGIRRIAWVAQQLLVKHGKSARGLYRLSRFVRTLVEPGSVLDSYRGREDYRFPGTCRIIDPSDPPDILHLHNLHGNYFDLRALPALSHGVPTVLTLHDLWTLTGFCTYPLGCERWQTGCGRCPLLRSRPSIVPAAWRKDGSAGNWREKESLYAGSRLFLTCPSEWLMGKAARSILAPSVIGRQVIPYGIDLSVFRPGDRRKAREALGIAADRPVALVLGTRILRNPVKGYRVIRDAMIRLGSGWKGPRVLLLVVGSKAPDGNFAGLDIRFVSHAGDAEAVRTCYLAADVYIHGATEDNFPNTVLEALACGTPVVSTAAGGIPEQVRPARVPGISAGAAARNLAGHPPEESTGILVPVGDSALLAKAVEWILSNGETRRLMGIHAAKDARLRFGLDRQLDDYEKVYAALAGREGGRRI